MLKDILVYLETLIEQVGPLGIAFATFIESLIAPIPSEVVLVFTGTSLDSMQAVFIFSIAATLGSYLGTLPFYVISYKSKRLINYMVDKYGKFFFINNKDIDEAEKKFKLYGKTVVFTGRLIPGVRSLISIPAGISKMNFWEYTIYTIAGSLAWNLLLITSGYLLREQYEVFLKYLDTYEKIVYAVLILIVVLVYLLLFMRSKRNKQNS